MIGWVIHLVGLIETYLRGCPFGLALGVPDPIQPGAEFGGEGVGRGAEDFGKTTAGRCTQNLGFLLEIGGCQHGGGLP